MQRIPKRRSEFLKHKAYPTSEEVTLKYSAHLEGAVLRYTIHQQSIKGFYTNVQNR